MSLCSAFNHSVIIHHQHALMMNPVSAKKMVMLLQEAYPARPKVGEYNFQSFSRLEIQSQITGNAFSQLPSCDADCLQPHAGADLILLFPGYK